MFRRFIAVVGGDSSPGDAATAAVNLPLSSMIALPMDNYIDVEVPGASDSGDE